MKFSVNKEVYVRTDENVWNIRSIGDIVDIPEDYGKRLGFEPVVGKLKEKENLEEEVEADSEPALSFSCKECGRKFTTERGMKIHSARCGKFKAGGI